MANASFPKFATPSIRVNRMMSPKITIRPSPSMRRRVMKERFTGDLPSRAIEPSSRTRCSVRIGSYGIRRITRSPFP